jgi:hypothetical protein
MDALPVRPGPPAVRPAPRHPARQPAAATHTATGAKAGHATAGAKAGHAAAGAKPDHPADDDDLALIGKQHGFDDMVRIRAELERESNALRDLAMAQVKRDDQAMRE